MFSLPAPVVRTLKWIMFAVIACGMFALDRRGYAADSIDVAVIISNKTYTSGFENVDFAREDGSAIAKFLRDKMGYRRANIIDLSDASKIEFEKVFGTDADDAGELGNYLDAQGRSNIVVYYSGRGATGQQNHKPYLMPVNGQPGKVQGTGYPLSQLFRKLSQLDAASISVFLDTAFSAPSEASTTHPIMPSVGTFMSVLIATGKGQFAHTDMAAKHSMFTRHLLDALKTAADDAEYGNEDGGISFDEIKEYLDHRMTQSVRRRFDQRQFATLLGQVDAEFYRYHAKPEAKPLVLATKSEPKYTLGADLRRDKNQSEYSDSDICVFATKKGGTLWETVGTDFKKFISEAKTRDLTLKDCEKLVANIDKAPETKSATATKPKKRARSSAAPFDGRYKIVAECAGVKPWVIGAMVTDGVMIIKGRLGWTIEGKFDDDGEIILEGTVQTTDHESLQFWAEAKLTGSQLDGRSIFTGRYSPVSCSFNGDRL